MPKCTYKDTVKTMTGQGLQEHSSKCVEAAHILSSCSSSAHRDDGSAEGVPAAGEEVCTWRDRPCRSCLWQEWWSEYILRVRLQWMCFLLFPVPGITGVLSFITMWINCISYMLCHFSVSFPHHQESMGARSHEQPHSSGLWYVVLLLTDFFRISSYNTFLFPVKFCRCPWIIVDP